MYHNPFDLFRTRRFWPLFSTQFLGAFNDNVFKNALVIWVTYRTAEQTGMNPQVLVTLAAGLFILPFFLFSATAGQLADKYGKPRLIQKIKLAEIVLMILGGVGFALGHVWFLMGVLFLMGAQSSFFGPLKYGILPDLLEEDELLGGNALIEAGTFVSILLGTILGGLLILTDHGIGIVSGLVFTMAALGWATSVFIPDHPPAAPNLRVHFNIIKDTWDILQHTRQTREVFLSILGISWFWFFGATYLAQFPNYCKNVLGGNEEIVTLFLTLFSIGVGIGSLLCHRIMKGEIRATPVPWGALGMTLFTLDLVFASDRPMATDPATFIGAVEFLRSPSNWRLVADLLLIAISAGVYIIPLYTLMQTRSEPSHRSRTIAGNNVMNALFMVASALGAMQMFSAGFSVPQVFLVMGILNAGVTLYVCRLLPQNPFTAWLRRGSQK